MDNLRESIIWVVSIIAILSTIGWAAAYKSIRNIVTNATALAAKYKIAMQDKELSQEELKGILPHMVIVIEESASVWAVIINAFYKLLPMFRKKC